MPPIHLSRFLIFAYPESTLVEGNHLFWDATIQLFGGVERHLWITLPTYIMVRHNLYAKERERGKRGTAAELEELKDDDDLIRLSKQNIKHKRLDDITIPLYV